jgi:DNA-binding NarL/FixJ family response regulator
MRKRLILADDHDLLLGGVTKLLEPDFDIVARVSNGRALVVECERLRPDLIIVDIGMPELNGIEAARRITAQLPKTVVVFLTQQLESDYIHAAFGAGARGYVAKQSASSELLEAIRVALAGGYYVTPLVVAKDPSLFAIRKHWENPANFFGGSLTSRQREVLQLVAEGKTAKEISNLLNISVKTVEFHKNSLMDELGLRTIAELTRYAMVHGIVDRGHSERH